ncbi:MAG: S49 family peptidase [Phycisphaerales bacterium]|nr:S49 family peptidase [Phycisphaerales bacterium]
MKRAMLARLFAVAASAAVCAAGAGAALAGKVVGFLTLEGDLKERQTVAPLFGGGEKNHTLRELVGSLDRIAAGSELSGLVIRLRDFAPTTTQVQEIGAAIGRIRASGKKVHVFGDLMETRELLLGSYADEVILQAGGAVSLPGVYAEEMFLGDMLKWVGVSPDFVQVGDYKGASEMFNARPTAAWEQNINQLLDGEYAIVRAQLRKGRGLTDAQLDAAMGDSFMALGSTAVRHRLIDAELDRPELDKHLEKSYGEDFDYDENIGPGSEKERPDLASMGMFEAFAQIMKAVEESGRRETTGPTIAVLHIDGAITDGESSSGGFMGEGGVGAVTIRKALADIEDDGNIRGVIVRIDSPGGSATASENIWLGLQRIRRAGKPVWVSVGSMAASGGYYILSAGERVYVNPSSIVGSIGVVGGKFGLGGVYEKLKINVIARVRGPRAGMQGGLNPWTDEERGLVRKAMTETYDLFVSRVKAGRPGIDIAKTAEGRLFTGEKAIEMKMADALGGLDRTVTDLAAKLGLAEGKYEVMDFPAPKSLEEALEDALGGFGGLGGARSGASLAELDVAGRQLLGERGWGQVRRALGALLQLRDRGVVLVAPRVVIFR